MRANSYAEGVSSGDPASYLTLEAGTDVLSAEGQRAGTVQHVLGDEQTGIFDGTLSTFDSGRADCSSSMRRKSGRSATTASS